MKRRAERATLVERGIRLAYDSLQSHLEWTYSTRKDELFHKKCVQQYADLIQILSRLY